MDTDRANRLVGSVDAVRLAEGGQRQVYKATSPKLGPVVIKFSKRNDRKDREIEQMQHLSIPFVPAIFESGMFEQNGNEITYVIERHIAGKDLAQIIADKGKLTPEECGKLLISLLTIAANYEVHEIVHRDIKPANIMLDVDNEFWLLDFGIARHLDQISLTATQQALGPASLGYCSPEQLLNRKREVDIRSDLFSIGVVAFEAATGINPFISGARDQMVVIDRIAHLPIPRIPVVDDYTNLLSSYVGTLTSRVMTNRPPNALTALSWFKGLQKEDK